MQCSFTDDPANCEGLFEFLDTVFPGLLRAVQDVRRLGASWESVSTPFLHFEGNRPVAHVGVIDTPLVLMDRQASVGTIHAVATHADFRRRGYYRRLMEEILEYSVGRYETLILSTENPEYYEPFGFRLLQEHCFLVPCDLPARDARLRLLDLNDDKDVALLNRLLDTRDVVSKIVGALKAKAVFCFNESHRPLYYSEDLDLMLCMEVEDTRLKLFDVVGPTLPSFDELLSVVPGPIRMVVFNFSPDRFDVRPAVTPHVLDHDGPSYLMARGSFLADATPFTLARSARA